MTSLQQCNKVIALCQSPLQLIDHTVVRDERDDPSRIQQLPLFLPQSESLGFVVHLDTVGHDPCEFQLPSDAFFENDHSYGVSHVLPFVDTSLTEYKGHVYHRPK